MVKQQSVADDNNTHSILASNPAGTETRRIVADANGALLQSGQDSIDRIFAEYAATREYKDDFSDGSMHGWQYQFDSSNRVGITLDDIAMVSSYSLLLHTRPSASDQAWARKGWMVPSGVSKILVGAYFMFHAANANSPASLQFDFDWQNGSGGSHRRYFSFRYLNYSGGLQNKWQVNTGTPTAQSFTDVTGGAMPVAWNESDKPLLCYMVGVIDAATMKYEKLYANGLAIDMTTQDVGPTAGTDLSNYDGGAIHIMLVANRSDSAEDSHFWVEKPILGYVYA